MRICGFILIGISVVLLIFFYDMTAYPGWFLGGMVLPGLIIGIMLVIAKQKEGYPEPP